MKKYEILEESKRFKNHQGRIVVLHRIRAVTTFHVSLIEKSKRIDLTVSEGTLGGWIEKEANLSQKGSAWIAGEAVVLDDAKVYGDAWVGGHASIMDQAKIHGKATIRGYTRIFDNAEVCGSALLDQRTKISKGIKICGSTRLHGAKIAADITIKDNKFI